MKLMGNYKMKTCLTFLMMLVAFSAQARPGQGTGQRQRLTLDFHGQLFRQESTIALKREILKKHPHINFQNWDLKRVVLHAKSARGYGEAFLQVGRQDSRVETIDGNGYDFRQPGNYHRVVFTSPGRDNGKWQIHMRGRIKVDKVVLIAQRKAPHRPQVTRSCTVQFETIWGKDIKRFSASATGPKGSGVAAKACGKALNKCEKLEDEIPLTQCVVI